MNRLSLLRRLAAGCLLAVHLCCTSGCSSSPNVVGGVSMTAPDVTDVTVDGTLIQGQSATVTVSAKVVNIDGTIPFVVADLTPIGGQADQLLEPGDNNLWSWIGTVTPTLAGEQRVTVTAKNEQGLGNKADVVVSIVATHDTGYTVPPPAENTPPEILNATIAGELTRGRSGSVSLSLNATDTEGKVALVTVDLSPIGGSSQQALVPHPNGRWNYTGSITPTADGVQTITFTAVDDAGATSTATASIAVIPPVSIRRNPLGYSTDVSVAEVVKVYIPSSHGGELTLSGADVQLVYTDGSDLTESAAGQVYIGDLGSVLAEGDPCSYTVPQGQAGWYYFRLKQDGPATISSSFAEPGESSYKPWNGWWWPWNASTGPTLSDPGGPFDKFDQVYGTQSQSWAAVHEQGGDWWWGHCWGWAIAAILVPEPQATTKNGVYFTSDDMKGLYTELADTQPYIDPSLSIKYIPAAVPTYQRGEKIDEYCDDLYRILRICIREDGVPILSDMRAIADPPDGGNEIWNQAIYKYWADFREVPGTDNERLVEIDMQVWSNFGPYPPPTNNGYDRYERFVYQLEFDAQGQVIPESPNQNWVGASHWPPHDLYRLTGSSWAARVPGITRQRVDDLYQP